MRKAKFKRNPLSPDPKYKDLLVSQFVNNLMLQGKKALAYSIFYQAIDKVAEKDKDKDKEEGLDIWKKALDNIMPSVEVKSRRIGGATFQVPIEVPTGRKVSLGMKWLIRFARQRNEHTMSERLAAEILAASQGEGAAVKKKEDMHRMAESNRAFSHFRF